MKASKVLGAAAVVAGSVVAVGAAACAVLSPRHGNPVIDQQWRELSRYRFAHRGLHGAGMPENSLAAFQHARENGFGVELDVHLTADGGLVVIHDSDIARMCGRPGIVERMTLDELSECRLVGTGERIPTFDEALDVFACDPTGETELPPFVIVELKTRGDNHVELCEKAVACLDAHLVRYCVESFDPRVVAWLRNNRPDVIRGLLAENCLGKKDLPVWMRVGGMTLASNALVRPDFVAYRYEDHDNAAVRLSCGVLGAHLVAWTIQCEDDLLAAEAEGAVVIFEGFLPA